MSCECAVAEGDREAWRLRESVRLGMALVGSARTADSRGRVVWLGARWHGMPMPLRLYLAYRHGLHPGSWPGCGCLVRIKSLIERIGAQTTRSDA